MWTIFTICVRYSPSNPCFFDTSIRIHHTLLLIDVTAKSWSLSWFFLHHPMNAADPIPIIFEVTLQAKKPRTLVDGKDYFWCHRWLLPSLISLLFRINSLLPKGSFLLLNFLYLLQNASRVSCDYFSVDPSNKLLIILFTWICWLFFTFIKKYYLMWVITHDIQPVTS